MKKFVFILISLVILLTATSPVEAHSGRTDSQGGHNCNVGACAGTYHYHNGGPALPDQAAPQAQEVQQIPVYVPPTSAPLRVATAVPTRIPTRIPTKIPTRIPTKKPMVTPTEMVTPTAIATPTEMVTPTITTPVVQKALAPKTEKGFWANFINFFFGK